MSSVVVRAKTDTPITDKRAGSRLSFLTLTQAVKESQRVRVFNEEHPNELAKGEALVGNALLRCLVNLSRGVSFVTFLFGCCLLCLILAVAYRVLEGKVIRLGMFVKSGCPDDV